MAYIRKRKDTNSASYQAVIAKGPYKDKPLSKTFKKKADAEAWASKIETEINSREVVSDFRQQKQYHIADMLLKHHEEDAYNKSPKTVENQSFIIERLIRDFAGMTLFECDAVVLYKYFVERRAKVKPDTLIKDIQVFSGMFRRASIIWRLPVGDNPAVEARKMLTTTGYLDGANMMHTRRLSEDEYLLIKNYQPKKFGLGKLAALFFIETGLRRGELCKSCWKDVAWEDYVLHVPEQKTDKTRKVMNKGRYVPLTSRAIAILRLVRYLNKLKGEHSLSGRIWPWTDPGNCTQAISRIYKRLGIEEIRVHDLRHDFCSVQADDGVDERIIAAAAGHKDLRSISRYTHPDMKKAAKKIASRGKR